MALARTLFDEQIRDYVVAHSAPADEVMRDLAKETYALLPDNAGMQIGAEQTAFMTLLSRMVGARNAVEVGTFTGMSSLSIARGMAEDGTLVCFDVSQEYTAIARRYWERAGVSSRIDLRIGDAREGLQQLPAEAYLDLAFIDADKTGYLNYFEQLLPRMRVGGVIAVDNVLWSGRVIDADNNADSTVAIREFNDRLAEDARVDVSIVPIGDGITLACKK